MKKNELSLKLSSYLTYTNNKEADQPVHPHSLVSFFVVVVIFFCLLCLESNIAINLLKRPQK